MFQFSGNVGQDAAVKAVAGKQVMEFSVGVYAGKKDGQAQTLWVKCSKWYNEGYQIPDWDLAKKGDTVIVSGIPNPIRQWEKDGKTGLEFSCMIDKVERLKKSESSGGYSQNQGATLEPKPQLALPGGAPDGDDDSLPF